MSSDDVYDNKTSLLVVSLTRKLATAKVTATLKQLKELIVTLLYNLDLVYTVQ